MSSVCDRILLGGLGCGKTSRKSPSTRWVYISPIVTKLGCKGCLSSICVKSQYYSFPFNHEYSPRHVRSRESHLDKGDARCVRPFPLHPC